MDRRHIVTTLRGSTVRTAGFDASPPGAAAGMSANGIRVPDPCGPGNVGIDDSWRSLRQPTTPLGPIDAEGHCERC